MCRQLAASLENIVPRGRGNLRPHCRPDPGGRASPDDPASRRRAGRWDPQQLEMVLLHELAHVRRYDNLVNLLQRIVESLLFFQPMVWIVSGWVRREREHCCDELVVARTRQPCVCRNARNVGRDVFSKPTAQLVACASPCGFLHGRAAAGCPHSPHSEEGGSRPCKSRARQSAWCLELL